MAKTATITRRDFVARYMRECGVPYALACKIYDTTCRAFEDGVIRGVKIAIGRVGAVVPVVKSARDIHMHFTKVKGGKIDTSIKRTYTLDGRFSFKFRLYKNFMRTRHLKWFLDYPN